LESIPPTRPKKNYQGTVMKTLYILGTLVLFLFALDLMISSLRHLGTAAADTIILATSNPFTGFFIGLLITAIVQSSSTTTSMAVALVASGSITLESAIPIIMGANVGTTITSTIVSLGFIDKRKEFRRAVAAGTYHDFFNILTAIILFPLEYYYGFLSSLSQTIANQFFNPQVATRDNSVNHFWSGFDPIINFLLNTVSSGFILTLLAFVLLFTSIIVFRKLISNLFLAQSPDRFSRFFFKNQFKSLSWGLLTTAAIRSSTITTSLVVPLVAKKIITLRKAVPFILGANIGTTITAFIAALLNSNSVGALSLAIAHLLFNVIGFTIFYPVPALRKIPLELAAGLGKLTLKYRLAGFLYILMTFFFIPFSLIYLNRSATQILDTRYERINYATRSKDVFRIISKMNTTTNAGEWLIYNRDTTESDADPDQIISVYKKNNILFINKEMHMFNKPGFCWDGENTKGKYQDCIKDILPRLMQSGLTFDSVYVYQRRFYTPHNTDAVSVRYYISVYYPLILRREIMDKNDAIIASENIIKLESK
jgi:solute carrier family 34 (sodium-dependent phosphate cotransporter)